MQHPFVRRRSVGTQLRRLDESIDAEAHDCLQLWIVEQVPNLERIAAVGHQGRLR